MGPLSLSCAYVGALVHACTCQGSESLDIQPNTWMRSFAEMARSRFTTVFGAGIAGGGAMLDATMSRVLLISPTNTEQLLRCLEVRASVDFDSACYRHHCQYCLVV